jgi:hypothetical protein
MEPADHLLLRRAVSKAHRTTHIGLLALSLRSKALILHERYNIPNSALPSPIWRR